MNATPQPPHRKRMLSSECTLVTNDQTCQRASLLYGVHENAPLLLKSLSLVLKSLSLSHCPCCLKSRLFSIESGCAEWLTFRIQTRRDLAVRRYKFRRQTINS